MNAWKLDSRFGLLRIGGLAIVQDESHKLWCALEHCIPSTVYKCPSKVLSVLGITGKDSGAASMACRSVRKYTVDVLVGGSYQMGTKTTLLLAFDYLHTLLSKSRFPEHAHWRAGRRPFTDLATLQVPSPLQCPQVCVKPGLPFRTKSAPS